MARYTDKALRSYKIRNYILVILNACLALICIIQIAIPFFRINMQEKRDTELLKIKYAENDQEKEIKDMFFHDATTEIEQSEDNEEAQFRAQLHFDLMNSMSYKTYGRKMVGIYSADAHLKDALYSELNFIQSNKVNGYSGELSELQSKEELTEEDSLYEYQLYKNIYEILCSGENIYQAGRAAEDAFWKQYDSGQDYKLLLEYAACSINCFEIFVTHENKVVDIFLTPPQSPYACINARTDQCLQEKAINAALLPYLSQSHLLRKKGLD